MSRTAFRFYQTNGTTDFEELDPVDHDNENLHGGFNLNGSMFDRTLNLYIFDQHYRGDLEQSRLRHTLRNVVDVSQHMNRVRSWSQGPSMTIIEWLDTNNADSCSIA